MKVCNLDAKTASELRAVLRRQKKGAKQVENQERFGRVLDASKSLEEELLSILAVETSDRDVQLLAKLWGWFGKKPRTLESVGREFHVTRERVRQIAEKTSRKIRKRKLVAPFLIKAARLIRRSCPTTAPTLIAELKAANISVVGVHPLGVAKACELFKVPLGLGVVNFGGGHVFSIEDLEVPLKRFEVESRRRTQANGCVNFNALCDELGISEFVRESLRSSLIRQQRVQMAEQRSVLVLFTKGSPQSAAQSRCEGSRRLP